MKRIFKTEKEFVTNKNKITIIPPSFGINIFNYYDLFKFLGNIILTKDLNKEDKKNIVLGAIRMVVKRRKIESYYHCQMKQNYVFHISSIWAKDTEFINKSRANFIRASKSIHDINFEGGLVDIGYVYSYLGNIKDVLYSGGKISLKEYINKTQISNFVFNGPSVLYCHGWKLAEYLSLGKAINSTPFYNDLPVPMIHGENIHFVEDNYESIKEAIKYLKDNPNYVKKLEKGALMYWNELVMPEKVIEKIFNFALKKI